MLVIEVPRSILQVVEYLRHGSNSSTQAKDIFGVLLIQELCHFIDRHLFHDTGAIYAVDGLTPDIAKPFCQVMGNTETLRENHLFMAAEEILHECPDIQRCIIVDFLLHIAHCDDLKARILRADIFEQFCNLVIDILILVNDKSINRRNWNFLFQYHGKLFALSAVSNSFLVQQQACKSMIVLNQDIAILDFVFGIKFE